jgi:predicted type IV restriction endonuclease
MSQLASFLENLRGDTRIATYNRLQLKQAVILKALHLLGWDAFDVSKVQADHLAGGMTIDYALQTPTNGIIFLHIVKPLDETTHDQQDKVLKLAAAESARIAVLTDGIHWSMFSPHQRGTFNDKEFARLNLTEQSAEDCEQILKHFLGYRIAVSGTAFTRAEKICADRLKKKQSNISTAQWQAWANTLSQFEVVFAELSCVEAKRNGGTVVLEDAQKFFAKFITMTTAEIVQAKKVKYEGFDIVVAQAWTGLLKELEPLFVELMIIDIEQKHDFKPEKETILTFLQNVENLHSQAVSVATGGKRAKQEA